MAEQLTQAPVFKSGLQKVQDTYVASIASSLKNSGIEMSNYQKQCVILAIQKMQDTINANKNIHKFEELDQSSISQTLTQVALMEINLASYPSEGYLAIKGDKMTIAPQGEGWRTLTEKFGRNVKSISEPWLVREGDDFKMPTFKGNGGNPPEWTPAFPPHGKVVLVVYGIEKNDGSWQWLFSSRDDVKNNLLAHIQNNLTKGMDKDLNTYNQLMKECENKTLDEILDDTSICTRGKVSPAWRSPSSRELMIVRKMKNNVLKNYPKDYKTTIIADAVNDIARNEDEGTIIDVSQNKADEETPKRIDKEVASIASPKVADFEQPKATNNEFVQKAQPKQQPTPADDDGDLPF